MAITRLKIAREALEQIAGLLPPASTSLETTIAREALDRIGGHDESGEAKERLDQIEEYWRDEQNDMAAADVLWVVALARRLLAVEEEARRAERALTDGENIILGGGAVAWSGSLIRDKLRAALADLDEWRKEQQ